MFHSETLSESTREYPWYPSHLVDHRTMQLYRLQQETRRKEGGKEGEENVQYGDMVMDDNVSKVESVRCATRANH